MILRLSQYKSFVFDCDGVILNSNSLKTNALSISTGVGARTSE